MPAVSCFLKEGEMMREALCTGYLVICAAQDLKKQTIDIRVSVFAGGAALLLDGAALAGGQLELLTSLGGLVPGVLLLALALFSGGAAGVGDGICFLVLGTLLGTWMTWAVLMSALILAAAVGALLMAFRKAGRRTHMPFLAFAAASWAIILAARLSGINW